jgi:hypothetical protein
VQVYALTSSQCLHETLDLFLTREAAEAELREILEDEPDQKDCSGLSRSNSTGGTYPPTNAILERQQRPRRRMGVPRCVGCRGELPQGLGGRIASSQSYRLPRAKKPSNASTTTMMMIHKMMEKTHLL